MSYDPNDAKSIFLQAAELTSSSERAAFLERVCAGKPELKARVESLLKTALDPDSLLDQPVADFGATQMVSPAAPPVSLDFLEPCEVPGRLGRLGGYEVLEVIGRGGMGIVLRAIDVKLNRVVAIKVLAPELASNPQARKRFLREAQAAAAVSHDHVVTIHAVDDDEKVPFLVMECIVGQSLQQKIDKEGALGLKEILRIGMQIASGLAAAHKQGLVHRDIKPANVLLENGVERVRITDFGLARASDDVGITQSGQIAGTPQYMSPEQAMGQPIDQRSDLFSLGSVLYTLCTGRPAFRADSAVAVLRRVCDDTPRPIGEVNAEVPDWLIAIVNRLMTKKPENRFQSAQEVASLLEQWLAHCQQPETVARPKLSFAMAPNRSRAMSTEVIMSNHGPRGVLRRAWDEWWTSRDRWVAISVQTALVLVYVVCMICFVSMSGSGGHDAEGQPKFSYRLGVPTPWFRFDVNQDPSVAFRSGFNLWTSSVLIGLIGCAAYYVYWRIEKVRNPKMSKWDRPAFMLGCWGIGALFAVGLGHWQGYAALAKPRVAVTPALDLNGVWDTTYRWPVGFTHVPIKPGMKSVSILGKYGWTGMFQGSGQMDMMADRSTAFHEVAPGWFQGFGQIDGTLDVATRTIEGTVITGNSSGRIRMVVSEDGDSIAATYGWNRTVHDEPVTTHRWNMWRRSKSSNVNVATVPGSVTPPMPDGKEFDWKEATALANSPPLAVAPFDTAQAKAHQEAWAKHRKVDVEQTNSIGMKFRLIPPGEFTMGTAAGAVDRLTANSDWYFARRVSERRQAEGPPRVVRISRPTYVGTHEVTVGQFAEFLKHSDYKTEAETDPSGGYSWRDGAWQRYENARWHNPGFLQTHDHPVCNVAWSDAVAFCEWLSRKEGAEYRLPREAEWEYACRAGSTTLFSTGDDPASLEGFANIADAATLTLHEHMTWSVPWNDGFAFTAPVGSFKPNNFGLFDMHGNVHEWCFDWYDSDAYAKSRATDPSGPAEGNRHVFRGGGWDSWIGFCRSADRYSSHSNSLRTQWAGFRVVLELTNQRQR